MTHIRAVVLGIVEAAIVVAVLEGAHFFFRVSLVGTPQIAIIVLMVLYMLLSDFINRRTQLALPYRLTSALTAVALIALWVWLADVTLWVWLLFTGACVRRLWIRTTPFGTQVTR